MSKRRFARSGQTDRHAASLVDTHETRVSDDIRGENCGQPARGLGLCVHSSLPAGGRDHPGGLRDVTAFDNDPRIRRVTLIFAVL